MERVGDVHCGVRHGWVWFFHDWYIDYGHIFIEELGEYYNEATAYTSLTSNKYSRLLCPDIGRNAAL